VRAVLLDEVAADSGPTDRAAYRIGVDVQGVSIFVSGGASGLGSATVEHLAAAGAKVGILDIDAVRGDALARRVGGAFVRCDVAAAESMEAAFGTLVDELGPPRVAIACAGIGAGKKLIGRSGPYPLDAFDRVIRVNLTGAFNLVRLAAWAMHELDPVGPDGERGVLVTTASIAATDGVDGGVAYSASKGGVRAMTLPLARDLAAWGIRAVSISPGSFDTPLVAGMPQEYTDQMASTTPFPPRFGHAHEFALLCEHVIVNPMLNGTDLRLDGGLRMTPSRLR
jgi:NAD(P)-dependent dehydrogenase (short-subunit alcohol dehydrogenase family)